MTKKEGEMKDYLYQKEKKDELDEKRRQHVRERLGEFINELCNDFGWEPLFDYNQSEVEDMIKGILK